MIRASYYAVKIKQRVYLNLCLPTRAFRFPDGSNIWSTVLYSVLYTEITKVKTGEGAGN